MELSSARRLFLLALVVSMCATAALAVAILLFGDFDETAARILGTTAAISAASLLALPASVLLDRARALPLAWASLGVSATAFVLALVLRWTAAPWPSSAFSSRCCSLRCAASAGPAMHARRRAAACA